MAIEPEMIRNVCLIGHRGSGKTALGEAMLGIASGRKGPSGNVLDHGEEEIERGMTLGMGVAHLEWKGRQIHIIVVNHLDRERTDFVAVVEQLRARFGPAVVPLNLPIGREGGLKGVYGLLSGIAFVDGQQTTQVPAGMEDEVEEAKIQLLETVAESDDTLLEKYLEGEELTTEEMFEGLRRGIADGVIIPVLATSVEKMVGVDRVLDVIAGSTPSPVDRSRWMTEA